MSLSGGYAVVEFRLNGARLGVANPKRWLTAMPTQQTLPD